MYPGPFGGITAGADKDYPIDYSHLNIQGYAVGAKGLPEEMDANPDNALFSTVDTETEYGWSKKVKMRVPILPGPSGRRRSPGQLGTFRGRRRHSGITLVCGENVCGVDPGLETDAKAGSSTPQRWTGESTLIRNSTRLRGNSGPDERRGYPPGVAEYVSSKHNLDTIELKWGQGAKCIGGEIKVKSLERALELQKAWHTSSPQTRR